MRLVNITLIKENRILMTYDKLVKFFENGNATKSVLVVSVEADLGNAISYLSEMLEKSEAPVEFKTNGDTIKKGSDILKIDISAMDAVELMLYTLGKKLAEDMENVVFRSNLANRNTKAFMRGVAEVSKDRVEIALKKEVLSYKGVFDSIKAVGAKKFDKNDAEVEMLRNLRSFRFREVANKEKNYGMLLEACLLSDSLFTDAAGMGLFIGENKKGVEKVNREDTETNALLRALCLENKIPFRHCDISDLYPLFDEVRMN